MGMNGPQTKSIHQPLTATPPAQRCRPVTRLKVVLTWPFCRRHYGVRDQKRIVLAAARVVHPGGLLPHPPSLVYVSSPGYRRSRRTGMQPYNTRATSRSNRLTTRFTAVAGLVSWKKPSEALRERRFPPRARPSFARPVRPVRRRGMGRFRHRAGGIGVALSHLIEK